MIRLGLLVAVAAAAAVLLNVLLLGRASGGNDPVGRLQPRVDIAGATTAIVPKWTVRPTTTSDDHHGRGDGSDD